MQLHDHFDDASPPLLGADAAFFRRKWTDILPPGSACVLSLASGDRVTFTASGESLDFTVVSPSQIRICVPLSAIVRASSRGASSAVRIAVHGAGGRLWIANPPGKFRAPDIPAPTWSSVPLLLLPPSVASGDLDGPIAPTSLDGSATTLSITTLAGSPQPDTSFASPRKISQSQLTVSPRPSSASGTRLLGGRV